MAGATAKSAAKVIDINAKSANDRMAARKALAKEWLDKETELLFELVQKRVDAIGGKNPEETEGSVSSIKAQGQTVKLARALVKTFDGKQLSLDDSFEDTDDGD
jgi:hypothetical protein